MTANPDHREQLPAPNRPGGYRHLFPIVQLLMERGHLPTSRREDYGFRMGQGLTVCHLTHSLTDEDWAAITERFSIPEHIVWWSGRIRDQDNGVQIQGDKTIISGGRQIPIEDWMARQDWSDLPPTR